MEGRAGSPWDKLLTYRGRKCQFTMGESAGVPWEEALTYYGRDRAPWIKSP